MKNLYIYTMNNNGELSKEVWEDIKITRDKGLIVAKKDAEYRLSHGSYKDKCNLDKVIRYSAYNTQYISLNVSEITKEIKQQLIKPFIDEYIRDIQKWKQRVGELEKLILEDD